MSAERHVELKVIAKHLYECGGAERQSGALIEEAMELHRADLIDLLIALERGSPDELRKLLHERLDALQWNGRVDIRNGRPNPRPVPLPPDNVSVG